jgi:class 3 adenylate cyclase/HD-GYP domain-containing protein (c-di-GMP phosphodiesterase class II)
LDEGKKGKNMKLVLPDNYLPMETAKLRLQSYLIGAPENNTGKATGFLGSEPIADFFPATTIMFADISGFTAWSSTREPTQVFTLLETIYGTMDKVSRKLGVFKVETVGDCYVAATGIPDPRDDHAVLMARFAKTCLQRINELSVTLESALGPGTGDLTMRIGIHSGAVTAGVLRGEKSRFQLFGDTMNTAARMETTGKAGRVHVSKETAELVILAGKGSWVEERGEMVTAKGKGELMTYWLKENYDRGRRSSIFHEGVTNVASATPSEETSNSGEDSDGAMSAHKEGPVDPHVRRQSKRASKSSAFEKESDEISRKDRLVDYNVEVLISLLKKIVARRSVVHDYKEVDISTHGRIALDEIKEVIPMPEYNPEAAVMMASDSTVEISLQVRTQLRHYIRRIAGNYHDNPFHNFEHASHVAMSATKLLKRIVRPEEVDYRRKNSKQNANEKFLAVAQDLHLHTLGISSDPVSQFSVVFAALIHDTGHTGVPNFILAKEEPETAAKYRMKSIAEQRSVDIAWDILMEDQYETLRRCMFPTNYELKHFRELIVNSIMATDIFDKELSALRKSRWQKCFHPEGTMMFEEDKTDAFNRKATIVIEHIIQASDVAHTMQHWHVYIKWNERLFQEMYSAFKEGRCDKSPADGWYKGELWFFDNYVIPLAKKLKECGVFGVSSAEYLNYAIENRDEWERKGEEVCKKFISDFDERLDK